MLPCYVISQIKQTDQIWKLLSNNDIKESEISSLTTGVIL